MSLKSQIQSLQQRTMLMQSELEDSRHRQDMSNRQIRNANSSNSSYHYGATSQA